MTFLSDVYQCPFFSRICRGFPLRIFCLALLTFTSTHLRLTMLTGINHFCIEQLPGKLSLHLASIVNTAKILL